MSKVLCTCSSCFIIIFQIDVVKALNAAEGPQWKTSLFGNPNDPETFRFKHLLLSVDYEVCGAL